MSQRFSCLIVALIVALAKVTCHEASKSKALNPWPERNETKFGRSSSSDWRTSLPQRVAGRSVLSQTRDDRISREKWSYCSLLIFTFGDGYSMNTLSGSGLALDIQVHSSAQSIPAVLLRKCPGRCMSVLHKCRLSFVGPVLNLVTSSTSVRLSGAFSGKLLPTVSLSEPWGGFVRVPKAEIIRNLCRR